MISWCKIENNQLVHTYGSLSQTKSDIVELVSNPWSSISEYGQQIGRTIQNDTIRVFTWSPSEQIIVADELLIKTPADTTRFPKTKFWLPLLEHMQSTKQQFSFTDDITPITPYLGYYGYFSFELSRLLDEYSHRDDNLPYPYLLLDLPTRILVVAPTYAYYIEIDLDPLSDLFVPIDSFPKSRSSVISHATGYNDYLENLRSIIDHIKQGDIYQANYTQQFSIKIDENLDPLQLYQEITRKQQLPHAAFLNYQDFSVMSLSPELFLQIEDGIVQTRPIKGTRPRGATTEEDQRYIKELQASEKDHAELSMIVDLLRNDLGKSALPGSVEVEQHAVIESYENVHHLVSTISARLEQSLEASWKLLLRAFPGGSISGVPKLRALELIEDHESVPRGLYTGNIGFLGFDGTTDLNIVIRTAIIQDRQVIFNAGGGIVFDSDPIEEYLESLHKAKHLANYFKHSFIGHIIYIDGQFSVADHVDLEPGPPGVFETILVQDSRLQRWEYHISRLRKGLQYHGLEQLTIPNQEDLDLLLRLNLIEDNLIRLNIYAWKGDSEHLMVKVQPYRRPSSPVSLLLSAEATSQIPSAVQDGMKSLEYGIYKKATSNAIDHHCFDSILYTPDDIILEGGRSTLFFFKNDQWYTPANQVVHGTIRQHLLDNGKVIKTDLSLTSLDKFKSIAVGNALIGILPVKSVQTSSGDTIWMMSDTTAINLLQSTIDK